MDGADHTTRASTSLSVNARSMRHLKSIPASARQRALADRPGTPDTRPPAPASPGGRPRGRSRLARTHRP